jgi:hypothetical protein
MIFIPKPSKATWNVPHLKHPRVMGGAKARLSRLPLSIAFGLPAFQRIRGRSTRRASVTVAFQPSKYPQPMNTASVETEENNSR